MARQVESLIERYRLAFERVNKKPLVKIYYEKGWFYINSTGLDESAYRFKDVVSMCETLDKRS
jgi:hypothetical protein